MAKSYTPFDPHEFEMRRAVLSTQRNDHTVDITTTLVELNIFEHIERAYLTGFITYVDTGRSIEIMDFQGTEFLDIEFGLYTTPHAITKRFVVMEVQSIVPTTDTTDTVTLRILDYDGYYQKAGYVSTGAFILNAILSSIVVYSHYLDNTTVTVYLTNLLFMGLKVCDVYSTVNTKQNVFYSAYLKNKVQFNDVDPDKIQEIEDVKLEEEASTIESVLDPTSKELSSTVANDV